MKDFISECQKIFRRGWVISKRKLLRKIISVASGARYLKETIFLKQMTMIFTIFI